tara:strand:+ start:2543 stop:4465 length:1923 start_codon:yes stop_codon:yes gene_type:complete
MAEEQKFNTEGAKQFAEEAGKAVSNLDKVKDRLRELAEINQTIGQGFYDFLDASDELTDSLGKNKDLLERIEDGQVSLNEAKKAEKTVQQQSEKLNRTADNMAAQLLGKKSKLTTAEKNAVRQKIDGMRRTANAQNKSMAEAVQKAKKGETAMAKGFESAGKKLKGIGLEKAGSSLSKIGQNFRGAAAKGTGLIKTLMSMTGIFKILKNLNPLGLLSTVLTFIFKTMLSVNSEITQLGRSMQITKDEARQVRGHFVNVANNIAKAGVEYEAVMEAQTNLNNALGMANRMISGDIIGGMAVLVERTKMSGEAAVFYGRQAIINRKTTEDISDATLQGSINAAAELGVRLNHNQVLENTAKITGELNAIFYGNNELMGQTVAKATALGRELKNVRDQSRGFLDFQSSISKEMEAEIFLGRQLNLDKLRLHATTGDIAAFQDELVNQAGSFLEFSQMSTFERLKLADALNMNVDELANMLMAQESINALATVLSAEQLEQVKANREQVSLQESFNNALKKLKVLVVNLIAELEKFGWFDSLTTWIDTTTGNVPGGLNTTYQNKFDPVVGAQKSKTEMYADDFIIKTHPKDTFVMAGGTQLGNNNGITREDVLELIEISKSNRTFEYDGFAAVKESGHYGTKFS